jgi:hypothetical protein
MVSAIMTKKDIKNMTENNSNQPSGRKRRSSIVIGVVVVVVMVIIALALLSAGGYIGANKYKATIYVHVTSTHIANVVDINLYANGNSFRTDSLSALNSQVYQYDAWLSGSSASIIISGTGQGGGLGDSSDSSTVEVSDGGTYNVYLTL